MENTGITVQELIKALELLNPDAQILFEYDGPETYTYKRAGGFIVADDNNTLIIVENHDNAKA